MGIESIALSIAGVYYIYPPCYAIRRYRVLYSCYTTMGLALRFLANIAPINKSAIWGVLYHFSAFFIAVASLVETLCKKVLYGCYTALRTTNEATY